MVSDPISRTDTSWDMGFFFPRKVASVFAWAANRPDPRTAQEELDFALRMSKNSEKDPEAAKHIQYKAEDLGKRTIAGLEASGMRITQTFPAGILNNTEAAAMPINSRPFTQVEEKWISDQYSIILLDTIDNEATGKSSYEVTSFTAREPDASIFQPPADYEIH